MIIAQSFWRKAAVTALAVAAFGSLYDVTILDSRYATKRLDDLRTPAPGQQIGFNATAYCKGLTTAAGVAVQSGIAAADPTILPVGSVVQVEAPEPQYDGIYTVLDTGPAVQGRHIDIYMWNCNEALKFGRKSIRLTVLRLGWNPRATAPTFLDKFLKRDQAASTAGPSRSVPQPPPAS